MSHIGRHTCELDASGSQTVRVQRAQGQRSSSRWIGIRHISLSTLLVLAMIGAPISALASEPECDRDPFDLAFQAQIEQRWPNNNITAEVEDLATGCRYSYNRDSRQSTASVIKISILAAVLLRAQDEGRAISDWERTNIVPMISESDDPTASALWVSLGGSSGMRAYLDRFGLTETTPVSPKWGASITSASDQVDLIQQLVVGGGPLEEPARSEARGFLLGVVADQQWGATAGVPQHWLVPMKNGFYPSAGWAWRINTVGLVEDPLGAGWALAVLTDGWSDDSPGIEAVEFVASAIASAMLKGRVPPRGCLRSDLLSRDVGSRQTAIYR